MVVLWDLFLFGLRQLFEVGEVVIKLSDQHAELGTPVTDMIGSKHIIAKELEDSANTVTLDGGSKMADVHILRNVG